MQRGQFCIAVTDRTKAGAPIRFVARWLRPGRMITTDNRPTFGRDGSIRTDDRILYFHAVRDAVFLIRRFPTDHTRLLTIWSERGPINPGSAPR